MLKFNISDYEVNGNRTLEGYCDIEKAWENYAKSVHFTINTLAEIAWGSQASELPIDFVVSTLPQTARGLYFCLPNVASQAKEQNKSMQSGEQRMESDAVKSNLKPM